MLSEVQIRFRRPGAWLQETSERHPEVSFFVTSLYEAGEDVHLSIVVVPADATKIAALEHEWRADARIKNILGPYEDPRGARFHFVYSMEYSTYPILVQHNLFSFRFSAVTGGAQFLTVMAEASDVEGLVKDLERIGTVELVSVRKISPHASPENPTPLTPLFRDLTEMQLRALILAYDRGYYSWPRKVTASQLAKGVGLTAPSFLHHLRLGESALIAASMRELGRREADRVAGLRADQRGAWKGKASRPRRTPRP